MFCGTDSIPQNISRIQTKCEKHPGILCGILLVPRNVVMDLNNVMIRPLYLINMWSGEDQRANIIKQICSKEIGLHHRTLITTLHSMLNIIARTYVYNQEINKHAHQITITKYKEIQFLILLKEKLMLLQQINVSL